MSCCRRKFSVISLGVTALLGGLTGCSTHPLPEDVARTSTVDIVRSIRCEALAGLEGLYNSLGPEDRARAAPIIKATVIGYDFEFNIEENNGAGGDEAKHSLATFKRAFTSTPSTLDVRGDLALKRENKRRFTIIEPLTDLPRSRDICSNRTKGPNWTYPITGTIGFDEIVRTYIKLEMLTELQQTKRNEAQGKFAKSAHVVFSDEVKFTTRFAASAEGTLVLDAVVGQLSVTNATIGVKADRKDEHSVVVAMTRAKVDVDERAQPRKAGGKETAKQERDRMIKDGSVRDPRAQARLIQMNSNAQDSVAVELHRRRNLNDRDDEAAKALGQRFLDLLKLP
jgi:hypothetical protein